MEFGKLYTVEEVAQITGLTDRTIRNYLKSGSLKGKKVGAQWRFTEDDVNALFIDKSGRKEIDAEEAEEKLTEVAGTVIAVPTKAPYVVAYADYPLPEESKLKGILWKFMSATNAYNDDEKPSYRYEVYAEQKIVRFIIEGEPSKVGEVLTFV